MIHLVMFWIDAICTHIVISYYAHICSPVYTFKFFMHSQNVNCNLFKTMYIQVLKYIARRH